MKNAYIEGLIEKIQDRQEVTNGEWKLARAYEDSIIRRGFKVLVLSEILSECDVITLVDALRESGIDEVYMTTQASNMLDTYLRLDELGLKLRGMVRLVNADFKKDMELWGRSCCSPTIPAMKFSFEEEMNMNPPNITTTRRWSAESVRTTCITHSLYTAGSCEDYDHMLSLVSRLYPNTENLYFIAEDIQKHSDDQTITNVMFILERDAVTTTFEIDGRDDT